MLSKNYNFTQIFISSPLLTFKKDKYVHKIYTYSEILPLQLSVYSKSEYWQEEGEQM